VVLAVAVAAVLAVVVVVVAVVVAGVVAAAVVVANFVAVVVERSLNRKQRHVVFYQRTTELKLSSSNNFTENKDVYFGSTQISCIVFNFVSNSLAQHTLASTHKL